MPKLAGEPILKTIMKICIKIRESVSVVSRDQIWSDDTSTSIMQQQLIQPILSICKQILYLSVF